VARLVFATQEAG